MTFSCYLNLGAKQPKCLIESGNSQTRCTRLRLKNEKGRQKIDHGFTAVKKIETSFVRVIRTTHSGFEWQVVCDSRLKLAADFVRADPAEHFLWGVGASRQLVLRESRRDGSMFDLQLVFALRFCVARRKKKPTA